MEGARRDPPSDPVGNREKRRQKRLLCGNSATIPPPTYPFAGEYILLRRLVPAAASRSPRTSC